MKKLSVLFTVLTLSVAVSPAFASDWRADLSTAVQNGKYNEIDVIAANNPAAQGDIAMYLLQQSQQNSITAPDKAVKLFGSSATFADQISLGQAGQAGGIINAMLALANSPDFEKKDPKGASIIYTAALAMSSDPNIIVSNPTLHNLALADASDYIGKNPAGEDKQLSDEVNLALQVGSPPPLGPNGVINPSQE